MAAAGQQSKLMQTPYGWNVCLPWEPDPAMLWRTQQALELLAPDRWMDYYCTEPVQWPGYVPTVRSWHLDGVVAPGVRERLYNHPNGETWLFLNEGHVSEQDDITPAKGRDLALTFINLAREMDVDMNWCGPNASINYVDRDSALYAHGRDWWREFLRLLRRAGIGSPSMHGVHLYHSTDRAMLQATWSALVAEWRRAWIGDKPVVITEVCAENQPFDQQAEVMDECLRLLEIGREQGPAGRDGVMGVFWFAAWDYGLWRNCALCEVDPDKAKTMRLTPLGRHWKELQARL